jgi:integrase
VNPERDSHLFPRHTVAPSVGLPEPKILNIEPDKPIGSWRTAWECALTTAKVRYRWHDLRHTFISRLAENPTVSEETIRSLAGHVSRQMLERYSHIRTSAKHAAIAAMENFPRGGTNLGTVPRAEEVKETVKH